ncbi:MAG: hypothetical protein R6V31_09225 [Halohasta sp.]
MGNITLLELHVSDGDIQLGPTSLRGSTATDDESSTNESPADTPAGGSRGRLLVAAAVVVLLVVMATKLLGEDADDELAALDDN